MEDFDIPSSSSSSKVAQPKVFKCSLSNQIMIEPVIVASGQTYELKYITEWLMSSRRCPEPALSHLSMTPNHLVDELIREWCRVNKFERRSEVVTEVFTYGIDSLLQRISSPSLVSDQTEAADELRRQTKRFANVRDLFAGQLPDSITRLLSPLSALGEVVFSNNKPIIGNSEALMALIGLIEEGELVATCAVHNLCNVIENRERAVALGLIPVLINKIKAGSNAEELLAILALISTNNRAIEEMEDLSDVSVSHDHASDPRKQEESEEKQNITPRSSLIMETESLKVCEKLLTTSDTSSPWSELPWGLAELICKKLEIMALLSIRGVCKSWLPWAKLFSRGRSVSPWFLTMKHSSGKLTLINPEEKDEEGQGNVVDICTLRFKNWRLIGSVGSWVLLHKEAQVQLYYALGLSVMKLPNLPNDLKPLVAAFSDKPTNPGATLYLLCSNKRQLLLLTLQRGDKVWDTTTIDCLRIDARHVNAMYFLSHILHIQDGEYEATLDLVHPNQSRGRRFIGGSPGHPEGIGTLLRLPNDSFTKLQGTVIQSRTRPFAVIKL